MHFRFVLKSIWILEVSKLTWNLVSCGTVYMRETYIDFMLNFVYFGNHTRHLKQCFFYRSTPARSNFIIINQEQGFHAFTTMDGWFNANRVRDISFHVACVCKSWSVTYRYMMFNTFNGIYETSFRILVVSYFRSG